MNSWQVQNEYSSEEKEKYQDVLMEDLHLKLQMLAKLVGIMDALRVANEFGGTDTYFPLLNHDLLSSEVKEEDIYPLHRTLIKLIGSEKTMIIAKQYGGGPFDLPTIANSLKPKRNRNVFEDCENHTVIELCRKYGCSTSTVKEILRKEKKRRGLGSDWKKPRKKSG